jgi:hypothetical protein
MFQVQSEIERLRTSVPHPPAGATQLWEAAKRTHGQDFSIWKKPPSQKLGRSPWVRVRLYLLWAGLPLGIGLVGVLVVVLGLVGVSVGE